jgi:hypothetical protein
MKTKLLAIACVMVALILSACGGSTGGHSETPILHYTFDNSSMGVVTNHPANASIVVSGDSPFRGNGSISFSYTEIENSVFFFLFPMTPANMTEVASDVRFEFMVKVSHPAQYMILVMENDNAAFFAAFRPKTAEWEKVTLRSFEFYPSDDNNPPDQNGKFDAENMTCMAFVDTSGIMPFDNSGARVINIDEFKIYPDTDAPTPAAELARFKNVNMGKIGVTPMTPYNMISPNATLAAMRNAVELGGQAAPRDEVGWADFEKTPGAPDFSSLVALRNFYATRCPRYEEGMQFDHRVLIVNMNVRTKLPADLEGAAFDNAALISRYVAFVKAYFAAAGIGNESVCFFISNETDTYFETHESEIPAFKTFYAAVKVGIKADYPNVRIGCITKYHGDRPDIIADLNNSSDVVAFTYYGHNPANFSYANLPPLDNVFAGMIALAGGKPVVITEIGFAASPLLGSTEEMQAAYITEFFDTYPAYRNEIEWATYCMQADMSEDFVDWFAVMFNLTGFMTPEFKAYLMNLGLYKSDYTPKKAVSAWKSGMSDYYRKY